MIYSDHGFPSSYFPQITPPPYTPKSIPFLFLSSETRQLKQTKQQKQKQNKIKHTEGKQEPKKKKKNTRNTYR